MAKLFLSYSRKESAKAQRFCEWLEREGHDVWRDEDDIGGGASFSSEIEKALEDCDAVLVLWSRNSAQSAWVRDEAGFGRDKGKLIPFSLDGTEPPLGFRQYQSIDLSKWRRQAEPPAAGRIRNAIARLGEVAAPTPRKDGNHRRSLPTIPRTLLAGGVLVLLVVAFLSLFVWKNWTGERGITIVVSESPNSPDRATAADYANVAAADMAAFLPTRFDGAKVIAPGNAGRTRGYRIEVAANRRGQSADASLTLSDRDGRSILWSKTWNVQDVSGGQRSASRTPWEAASASLVPRSTFSSAAVSASSIPRGRLPSFPQRSNASSRWRPTFHRAGPIWQFSGPSLLRKRIHPGRRTLRP